jgi:hypothetical protein
MKPVYANARLVRAPTFPQSEWSPVSAESKLAKN